MSKTSVGEHEVIKTLTETNSHEIRSKRGRKNFHLCQPTNLLSRGWIKLKVRTTDWIGRLASNLAI